MSKAERISSTTKQLEYFSDFLNNFDLNPITKSLSKVSNEQSVKQSIRNLVLTNKGERFYRPDVGGDIYKSLFESNDIIAKLNIENSIKNTIENYEKRAIVRNVTATPSADKTKITVTIVFSLINSINDINLTILLKRIR